MALLRSASASDPFGNREVELTDDHQKLLYLLSKYACAAESRNLPEGWIRQSHFYVLIYEGIVADVFDYDYAPLSAMVGPKRLWMNISQEGKDDIDDLREMGFINGLKLATEDLQPVTAYQVSLAGLKKLPQIPQALRDQVWHQLPLLSSVVSCASFHWLCIRYFQR